ncbi:protein-tyrosine phosphatase family protein [Oceanicola sp. S124]|uniref:protein-tyrosine phosphatase family protein n=1 Tax=Oceanicola sp. S124 TaxID=1042378 RepID=UPI000255815E|nr:dual specificity protein phosphatase [Oceanicola sp. S124]
MSDATELLPLRARVALPGGGACIMSGFPGLESGVDGVAWISPEMLEATLAELARQGAERLLILTEESELPEGACTLLDAALARHGIVGIALPIRDFHAPEKAFLDAWAQLGPRLHAAHRAGGISALCCQYGAGRSGLVAALILIEGGMAPDDAVAHVRAEFEDAVESDVQMQWLQALSPGRPVTG